MATTPQTLKYGGYDVTPDWKKVHQGNDLIYFNPNDLKQNFTYRVGSGQNSPPSALEEFLSNGFEIDPSSGYASGYRAGTTQNYSNLLSQLPSVWNKDNVINNYNESANEQLLDQITGQGQGPSPASGITAAERMQDPSLNPLYGKAETQLINGQRVPISRNPGESISDFTRRIDSGSSRSSGFGGTSGVGTSTALRMKEKAQELARIKAELAPAGGVPTLFKSQEEFKQLRQEKGVVQDEEELLSLRNEALLAQQEFREFKARAGTGVTEGGRLGAVSEAERNMSFRLEGLALRERAVLDRLNTKNAYINTILKLGQEDYSMAVSAYEGEYNRNLRAVQLYNEQLDDEQQDALTALATMNNLLKDREVDFATLDPSIRSQMNTMEMKAGLPAGIFEAAFSGMADEKILSPITVENASGGKDVYFFTQDSSGVPHLRETVNIEGSGQLSGSYPASYQEYLLAQQEGYGGSYMDYQTADANRKRPLTNITVRAQESAEKVDLAAQLTASGKGGQYADGNVYTSLRAKSGLSASDFDARYSYLLSPADKSKYNIKGASMLDFSSL